MQRSKREAAGGEGRGNGPVHIRSQQVFAKIVHGLATSCGREASGRRGGEVRSRAGGSARLFGAPPRAASR